MFNYLQSVSKKSNNVGESNKLHPNSSEITEGVTTGPSGGTSKQPEESSAGESTTGAASRGHNSLGTFPFDFSGWSRLSFDERRKELARTIFHAVRQDNRLGKYISAVYKSGGAAQDSLVRELIYKHASNAAFKWFIKHHDHYHIVHDCTYSGGSCRCFNKFPFERRLRRLISLQTLTAEDYELLIKYHFKEGRRVEILEVRGVDYSRLFRGLESLQNGGDTSRETTDSGDVEVCTPEDKVLWLINDRSYDSSFDEFFDVQDDQKESEEQPLKKRRKRNLKN